MEAGRRLAVDAIWTPGIRRLVEPDGLLTVKDATPGERVDRLEFRVRNVLARASATLYGARAPLVDALVVGRRSGMDRQLKTSFASSGLVHLLSISGFHIGLIAAWVVLILRQLGMPRVPSLAVAASVAMLYVAFLGWPAPAVRAAAMAWVLVWLRWRQRAVQPDAMLAATGLVVLLLDPFAVFDLGGWLSVLSLWGAVRFARWAGGGRRHALALAVGSIVGRRDGRDGTGHGVAARGRGADRYRAQLRRDPGRCRGGARACSRVSCSRRSPSSAVRSPPAAAWPCTCWNSSPSGAHAFRWVTSS